MRRQPGERHRGIGGIHDHCDGLHRRVDLTRRDDVLAPADELAARSSIAGHSIPDHSSGSATTPRSVVARPSQPSVHLLPPFLYPGVMDVAVTELRAHLSDWLERARQGDEIVVTDRGIPVARLLGVDTTATLTRLTRDGAIGRPVSDSRPRARGRARPKPGRPVADRVSEQRR